jgi:hypothetical protein
MVAAGNGNDDGNGIGGDRKPFLVSPMEEKEM